MTSGRGRSLNVAITGDADKLKRELAAAQRAVREAERDLARMGMQQSGVAQSGDRMTQSLSRQERIISSLQRNWQGYAAGITAVAAAGAAAVVSAQQFVNAARDEAEALNRSNEVFGANAREIEDWAARGDQAFGLSRTAALGAAGTFGNVFDQLDLGSDRAANMSMSLVQLSADFASFHNADITQVIEAQTAAFRGEYDALQRFVPTINAAAVQQKALEMGLAASTQELTEQDKALATYELIISGAGKAQGDFARTSDDLANQQRILDAQLDNLQANIGRALIPAFTDATGALNDFLDAHAEDIARGIAAGVDAIAESLGNVQTVLQAIRESGPVRITFELLGDEVPTAAGEGDGTTWGDLAMRAVQDMNPFSRGMLPWSLAADALEDEPVTPFLPTIERELERFNAARPGEVVNRPLTPSEEAAVREFGRAQANMNAGPVDLGAARRWQEERRRRAGRGGGGRSARDDEEDRRAADEQRRFLAEMESIQRDYQAALRDAYFEGGAAQVEAVRAQQEEMTRTVMREANELREALEIDLVDAMQLAREHVEAVAEAERQLAEARARASRSAVGHLQGMNLGAGTSSEVFLNLFENLQTAYARAEGLDVPISAGMRPYDGEFRATGPNSGVRGMVNYGEINVSADQVDAESFMRLQDRMVE